MLLLEEEHRNSTGCRREFEGVFNRGTTRGGGRTIEAVWKCRSRTFQKEKEEDARMASVSRVWGTRKKKKKKKKKTKKKKRVSDMPRAQFSTLARKRLENVLITLKLTSAFEMQIKFLEYMISNVSWAQKLLFVLFRRSSASRRPVRTIAIIPKILGAENGRSPDTSPDWPFTSTSYIFPL